MAFVQISDAVLGGVEVDFDRTFLVQIGLFIVLMLVLKPVLFDPMLALFEAREKRIDGAKKMAHDIDTQSTGALVKYETAMAKARGEANAERDRVRGEGVRRENELLADVRLTTGRALEEGRAKAKTEMERVRDELRTDAQTIARDVASRVLGREVSG